MERISWVKLAPGFEIRSIHLILESAHEGNSPENWPIRSKSSWNEIHRAASLRSLVMLGSFGWRANRRN